MDMKKATLYFLIATMSVLVAGDLDAAVHGNVGVIVKLILSATLAGLTAVKALQSTPDTKDVT